MATKKSDETVETTETVKVTGTVEKPVEREPVEMKPEKAAKAPPADEKVMADIGQLRVQTAAEKRIVEETGDKEDHWLRPAKEAHADAAKISVLSTVGTEMSVGDLDGSNEAEIVRVRLLFDWNDGQGVGHPRGKQMDLPKNEAVKLVREGFAERANPPEPDPIVAAMAEARMSVLERNAK